MDLKLISKNNMGCAATLFLVILLSQSRFLNFLIDTALGRIVLILFILGISYANKILGVVAVLFIIIMFNQSDISYLEGFTSTTTTPPSSSTTTSLDYTKNPQIEKDKMKQNSQQIATTTSSTVSSVPTTTTTTSETFSGREGFNMIDREGTMLKGKRSNEIPVFSNYRSQDDDVEPSDKSVFSNSYTTI